MNNKFDELTKTMAQSVTRRGALKKFGVGVAALALTALSLPNKTEAKGTNYVCNCHQPDFGCAKHHPGDLYCSGRCFDYCNPY